MKCRRITGFLISLFLVGTCSVATGAPQVKSGAGGRQVLKSVGVSVSPNGTCRAVLKTSQLGGFLVLTLDKNANRRVNDVTGMAWVSNDALLYTTSPIYGEPGVYLYSCGSNRIKRIVAPRTFDKAYPKGADYFELERISNRRPVTVFFYYAPDVDKVNFKSFRVASALFEVRLDGSGFKKAQ